MKPSDYINQIIKLPGVRGIYVFNDKGEETLKESSYEIEKNLVGELVEHYQKNESISNIVYFITHDHIVVLGKNKEVFKGLVMIFTLRTVNLGLLRIYLRKFLKL